MVKVHREALEIIAEEFGVTVDDITGVNRMRTIARARQCSCLILRERFSLSSPEIGLILNLCHGTVLSSWKRSRLLIDTDDLFHQGYTQSRDRIASGRRVVSMNECVTEEEWPACNRNTVTRSCA